MLFCLIICADLNFPVSSFIPGVILRAYLLIFLFINKFISKKNYYKISSAKPPRW